MILRFDWISKSFLSIEWWIDTCFNDEHPLKVPYAIEDMEKHLKMQIPITVTDDGIVICLSDEHPSKEYFPIEVTDDWIVICMILIKVINEGFSNSTSVNDLNLSKVFHSIVSIDDGIKACFNDKHFEKV